MFSLKVCSRWHDVVMTTPRFWATIVADTRLWPRFSGSSWMHVLVASSLARSRETPLDLRIAFAPHYDLAVEGIMELLCKHSHRWKTVQPSLHPCSLGAFAHAKRNLPLLDSLTLSSPTNIGNYADDIFATAPRLRTIRLIGNGWPTGGPKLPWGQLHDISYENGESRRLSLVSLRSLSTHASCALVINPSASMLPHELTPVTSNLSNLSVSFGDTSGAMSRTYEILGIILRSLTLPSLASLRFIQHVHTGDHDTCAGASPPQAPHRNRIGFLAFAACSALDTLTQLEVYAVIRDHELLECLLQLPLLEELRLWDCVEDTAPGPDDGLAVGRVITDALLRKLTFCPVESNSLVPHLNILALTSVMSFREGTFLELVASRMRPDGSPFVAMMLYDSRCSRRKFAAEALALLAEYEESGELIFAMGSV
ncbi:hypothetical protein DFH06DRAFT_582439 [Mycena polygramma]|nr:hypothetical protein DFH06DRAFT_582439 [Mycena polygramma]